MEVKLLLDECNKKRSMSENFLKISFLITHYNRPLALEQCIDAIHNLKMAIKFEIVVSDDFSDLNVLDKIKTFRYDKLILSEKNLGLAANLNKGIKACDGEFILYCQEDFLIKHDFKNVLSEVFKVLDHDLDMVRLRANYTFPKLVQLTKNVYRIPKFSFRNFYYNAFQYSDNPFVVNKIFYDNYGLYLENTDSDYGEAEFAIRIFKSNARIGILNKDYIANSNYNESVVNRPPELKLKKAFKKFKRFARAFRLHIEYLFYDKNKRGLLTYKRRR